MSSTPADQRGLSAFVSIHLTRAMLALDLRQYVSAAPLAVPSFLDRQCPNLVSDAAALGVPDPWTTNAIELLTTRTLTLVPQRSHMPRVGPEG